MNGGHEMSRVAVNIRLANEEFERLRVAAKLEGVTPTTLAKSVVLKAIRGAMAGNHDQFSHINEFLK